MNWKTLAIILLVIVLLENGLIGWGYASNNQIEKQTNICYYEICADYPDAYYTSSEKLCDCYENDLMGNRVIAKTKYMGNK